MSSDCLIRSGLWVSISDLLIFPLPWFYDFKFLFNCVCENTPPTHLKNNRHNISNLFLSDRISSRFFITSIAAAIFCVRWSISFQTLETEQKRYLCSICLNTFFKHPPILKLVSLGLLQYVNKIVCENKFQPKTQRAR